MFSKNTIGWIYLAIPRNTRFAPLSWKECDLYRFRFTKKTDHNGHKPHDKVVEETKTGKPSVIESRSTYENIFRLQIVDMKRTWSRRSGSDREEYLEVTDPNDVLCILTGWSELEQDVISYLRAITEFFDFRTFAKINCGNIDLAEVLTADAFEKLPSVAEIVVSGKVECSEEQV